MYNLAGPFLYKETDVLDLSNKGIENDPDRPDNFIYKSLSYDFTRIYSLLSSLCLTGNKLTELPGSIKHLRYLRTLQLGYNKLSKLPRWIEGLKNLESLILTKNQFTSLPESIGSLTNLKELGLSGNNIESIPNNFKKLRPDIKIYYKRKQYTRHEFMELFKIVKTRVSSNTDIFNKEFSITNKISNVRKNRLSYIKKNLNPNGTLKRVYSSNSLNRYMKDRNKGRLHGGTFSSNNIRKLTNKSTINKNVYLRNINIRLRNSSLNNFENTVERIKTNLPSNVSQTDVNDVIRSMKPYIFNKIVNKLKKSPSNNRVSIIKIMKKRGLINNSDIKKLNIGDRGHYNINTTIITNNRNSVVILGKRYNINTTTRLNLFNKNLSSLPSEIGLLTNLEDLDLSLNKLTLLPSEFGFGRLTKLRDLNLSYNKLISLPESIGEFTKLEKLYLNFNKLTQLPESIDRLTNLKELNLSRNKLTKLPESFGRLTKLEELGLAYTNLSSLPNWIGRLINLEKLDLENNKLTSLPESIGRLTNLEELNLRANKLISLPKSFKNLDRNLRILTLDKTYNRDEFIKLYGIVDKNVYLRNINIRLRNSSLNNFENTVERIKTNLPSNVSRNDVNTIVRSMKPQVLQKIFNKLKNSPSNNRVRIMNTMKNRGFMNQNDINVMKKKLLGSNFVRNSKKPLSTTITKKVNKMNHNNVRKSPYI
jgi:Leucine-rich repeat (LRR) protein